MAGIFTRGALGKVLADENLTPEERIDQIYSLYGRAIDDGYITKSAAQAAQQSAIDQAKADWEKGQTPVDVKETAEYKALVSQFDAFKTRTNARNDEAYKGIKPKFFDTVYDLIDHGENAKPVAEQLSGIREKYDEYFAEEPKEPKPQFGSPDKGAMPKGDEGAVAAFTKAWNFK